MGEAEGADATVIEMKLSIKRLMMPLWWQKVMKGKFLRRNLNVEVSLQTSNGPTNIAKIFPSITDENAENTEKSWEVLHYPEKRGWDRMIDTAKLKEEPDDGG